MSELSTTLRTQARNVGLCDKWFGEWKDDEDKQALLDKYIRGIDFCIKWNYPSLSFAEQFGKDILHKNNIYINENFDIDRVNGIVVINGNSRGNVSNGKFDVATIYIRHDSDVTIKATGMSRIFIRLHDNAHINVEQSEEARVYVHIFGKNATCTHKGNVNIRHSE